MGVGARPAAKLRLQRAPSLGIELIVEQQADHAGSGVAATQRFGAAAPRFDPAALRFDCAGEHELDPKRAERGALGKREAREAARGQSPAARRAKIERLDKPRPSQAGVNQQRREHERGKRPRQCTREYAGGGEGVNRCPPEGQRARRPRANPQDYI